MSREGWICRDGGVDLSGMELEGWICRDEAMLGAGAMPHPGGSRRGYCRAMHCSNPVCAPAWLAAPGSVAKMGRREGKMHKKPTFRERFFFFFFSNFFFPLASLADGLYCSRSFFACFV